MTTLYGDWPEAKEGACNEVCLGEMLGARLLTQHNLHFYAALMREARRAILERRYLEFARATEARMRELDEVGAAD